MLFNFLEGQLLFLCASLDEKFIDSCFYNAVTVKVPVRYLQQLSWHIPHTYDHSRQKSVTTAIQEYSSQPDIEACDHPYSYIDSSIFFNNWLTRHLELNQPDYRSCIRQDSGKQNDPLLKDWIVQLPVFNHQSADTLSMHYSTFTLKMHENSLTVLDHRETFGEQVATYGIDEITMSSYSECKVSTESDSQQTLQQQHCYYSPLGRLRFCN